jgi:hypothetical protein
MSLRFAYKPFPVKQPPVSLPGRSERPRAVIVVSVLGPANTHALPALLDTGADDTVFTEDVAVRIGLDLTNAPTGGAAGAGMVALPVRYAQVTLRIADNQEQREWQAWVGFTTAKLRQPLLGFAGFLQYFTATFHGDLEEVELAVNGTYMGT